MNLALIIPAYNEQLTIADAIQSFVRELPEATVIVVDNNSTDGTGRIAAEKMKELNCRGRVLHEDRQGKGWAVRRAFQEVDADLYIMVDADMTYPAAEVHKLIAPVVDRKADMAVGDRLSGGNYRQENKRKFHNFGNALVTGTINNLFHADLKDIMSGYRVMTRQFVDNYPVMCGGFEIETEMTLHALDKRFRIIEIPVRYVDRPSGSTSKLATYKDGIRILKTIVSVFKDYRPFFFFGLVAFLFFLCGLGIGIPVISEYVRMRYIYRVPSAVLATGLMIISLFLFGIGLILDTVVRHNRLNYELQLMKKKQPLFDAGDQSQSDGEEPLPHAMRHSARSAG